MYLGVEEEQDAIEQDSSPALVSHYQDDSYQRSIPQQQADATLSNGMEQRLDSLDLNQADSTNPPPAEEAQPEVTQGGSASKTISEVEA